NKRLMLSLRAKRRNLDRRRITRRKHVVVSTYRIPQKHVQRICSKNLLKVESSANHRGRGNHYGGEIAIFMMIVANAHRRLPGAGPGSISALGTGLRRCGEESGTETCAVPPAGLPTLAPWGSVEIAVSLRSSQ